MIETEKKRIFLYNTRTRSKEPFVSQGDCVSLYTCGPTVYNFAHIGNLRTFLFEDILKRTLLFNGLKVKHVMNITDVGHLVSDADTGDDKMETGAVREGKTVWDIAAFYTQAVMADFKKLNFIPADIYCKATDHIAEQINLIKTLEDKGYAYIIDDGVYFDTSKFSRYADFARLRIDELEAGARVEMVKGKRQVTDFALWKFSPKDKQRQMEWESPWGKGFPGWHIECSAMAMKHLGETPDIHCGGIDHIPVHHTNEIAQSEAATGKPFANFWLHGEFLVLEKEKMAKSGGNFIILKTLEERGIGPFVYRFFCLSAHYRAPLAFSWEAIQNAQQGYNSLVSKISELRNNPGLGFPTDVQPYEVEFQREINDDLNMPRAIAVLWKVLRSDALQNSQKLALAESFDRVFGLGLGQVSGTFVSDIPAELLQLLNERNQARKAKDWPLSDCLRDTILEKGYKIIDTATGAKLEKIT
ncbi:MAG: cysteine--tRNA ligase [Candidatus Raymondbacteria bacterium RifOxyC12_full_50_8]|uniref:Cysteine--tRNA ligase n=1 Tax=Candidatus Raymondbacteria bacterium RIFOXYD12_FULL_49_13 TaxID=1817890 RepID=A0A1F7F9F2_UNCRA|nr:MAG: cysteine--tRNA ligase [Candidatus Raymondbacteria bacterium RIFOXYA2_FULL_49_16]OGJ91850.1 MAG: cysteine--tRNA ligase [Candidatus Raymondbacteria bacterium RifOxyB12_full_50_8]OGJ95491.1 MAG: cysteine--tRNA ligase [Candidatus Raymondbacteria bacterium RifOxyC12_full_50_8]OGJ97192.1 MAG: cysteine--tRNA ligase [Candidatus Raymondbacteria bacterium RIFOXYC2_FULL_50_21]OGK03218.1 MAG: cysteine--tRNA ligase [Candidatus Raymondbacteria bacterium RIFOXYD12_FULL_49_13]OGP42922.1 MAG: cysteine-